MKRGADDLLILRESGVLATVRPQKTKNKSERELTGATA